MSIWNFLSGVNNSEPEKNTADMNEDEFKSWLEQKRADKEELRRERDTINLSGGEEGLRKANRDAAIESGLVTQEDYFKQVSKQAHERYAPKRTRTEWKLIDGYMQEVEVDE